MIQKKLRQYFLCIIILIRFIIALSFSWLNETISIQLPLENCKKTSQIVFLNSFMMPAAKLAAPALCKSSKKNFWEKLFFFRKIGIMIPSHKKPQRKRTKKSQIPNRQGQGRRVLLKASQRDGEDLNPPHHCPISSSPSSLSYQFAWWGGRTPDFLLWTFSKSKKDPPHPIITPTALAPVLVCVMGKTEHSTPSCSRRMWWWGRRDWSSPSLWTALNLSEDSLKSGL